MLNVILSEKPWHRDMARHLEEACGGEWVHIDSQESFTVEILEELSPSYVFIPHWSHIIGPEIYNAYRCVIFHMTDLPYGRGGSPLQNLIANGNTHTKISAIECGPGIDTGGVYLKSPLQLYGTAREIFERAAIVIEGMIYTIITQNPTPQPQEGEAVLFRRRRKKQSNIGEIEDIASLYDLIRMLDCEGYPAAYLATPRWHLEFSAAELREETIIATVSIKEV
jgi:methionyl-tRNA formyltransferase